MNWTELGWKDFLRGTLRELEMGHVLEFCLFRDPVSGRYRMEVEEEEKTDEQLQRELDRKAKRLLALFEDETRWRINPSRPCLEMRGDSQCVIRSLTGRYRCRNEVYARRVRDMQHRLYDMCVQYHILSPESGRDVWKWVYREGNDAADHETHVAREKKTTSEIRWDHSFLNSLRSESTCVRSVRGSFDGGKCDVGVSCGWVIDLYIVIFSFLLLSSSWAE